jgi:hypothetical protein
LFRKILPYVSPSSVTTINKAIAGEWFTFQLPSIFFQHGHFTRNLRLWIIRTAYRWMKDSWNQDEGWSFTRYRRWAGRYRRRWRECKKNSGKSCRVKGATLLVSS